MQTKHRIQNYVAFEVHHLAAGLQYLSAVGLKSESYFQKNITLFLSSNSLS